MSAAEPAEQPRAEPAAGSVAADAVAVVAGPVRGAAVARRRRRVEGGRRQMLNVRYSEEELRAVQMRAAAAGWEVTSYVAEVAVRGPVRVESSPGRGALAFRMSGPERQAWAGELMAVRRIVGATANNVNQLAKVANATGEVPVETAASLAACERAMTRLGDLLAALEDVR